MFRGEGALQPACKTQIKWQDLEGLEVLGIHFFADPLRTSNANWLLKYNILKLTLTKASHRPLSFRGKVINLNSKVLSNFWYLGSVIPFPKWCELSVNRLIFAYLWGEGKQEPINRNTVLLPKALGGLGIFQPLKQSLALRTKFSQSIGETIISHKWVYLARYFIGF